MPWFEKHPACEYMHTRVENLEAHIKELSDRLHSTQLNTLQQIENMTNTSRAERVQNLTDLQKSLENHIIELNKRLRELEGSRQFTMGQYATISVIFTLSLALANLVSGLFF